MDDLSGSFNPLLLHVPSSTRSKRVLIKFNSKSNLFPPDFFDLQRNADQTPNFKFALVSRKPRARSCRNANDVALKLQAGKILDFKDDSNKENKTPLNLGTSLTSRFQGGRPSINIKQDTLPQIKRSKSMNQQQLFKKQTIVRDQKQGYISIQQMVSNRQQEISKQYKTEEAIIPQYKLRLDPHQEQQFSIMNRKQTNKQVRGLHLSHLEQQFLQSQVNVRKAESTHMTLTDNVSQLRQKNLFKIMKRRVIDSNLVKFFQ